MKFDIITKEKDVISNGTLSRTTIITIYSDLETLNVLKDIIDMKLKLKDNISTTLVLPNSIHLKIALEGE